MAQPTIFRLNRSMTVAGYSHPSDVGDIGEPDPVRGRSREVARDQVRCDWQVVTAVGGAHTARPCHDGADTVPVHQPFDPATAGATTLPAQGGMDAGTAIASAAALMDLADLGQERGICFCPLTHRAIAPGVIASR